MVDDSKSMTFLRSTPCFSESAIASPIDSIDEAIKKFPHNLTTFAAPASVSLRFEVKYAYNAKECVRYLSHSYLPSPKSTTLPIVERISVPILLPTVDFPDIIQVAWRFARPSGLANTGAATNVADSLTDLNLKYQETYLSC